MVEDVKIEEFSLDWIKSLGLDFLDLIKRFEDINHKKQYYNKRLKEYLDKIKPDELALLLLIYYEESKECKNTVNVLKEVLDEKIRED
ncbi:hypothetical protein ACFL1L_02835, partial [Thermoplasmatota archaeon]